MRIPLKPEQLDRVLTRAEGEGSAHLEFLRALISEQADQRRERGIAYRLATYLFRGKQDPGRLRLAVQRQCHRSAADRGVGPS